MFAVNSRSVGMNLRRIELKFIGMLPPGLIWITI